MCVAVFNFAMGSLGKEGYWGWQEKVRCSKQGYQNGFLISTKVYINQSNCDIYAEFQDFNLLEVLKITQT